MTNLSLGLDRLLQEVILKSENQLEFLLGSCESEIVLTNTQEHILMLIDQYHYTSSEIAKALNISQAAVTKAVKLLLNKGMLEAVRDEKDARIIHYSLTELSKPIAAEHAHHHESTLERYEELFSTFSQDEQVVLEKFIDRLGELIR